MKKKKKIEQKYTEFYEKFSNYDEENVIDSRKVATKEERKKNETMKVSFWYLYCNDPFDAMTSLLIIHLPHSLTVPLSFLILLI